MKCEAKTEKEMREAVVPWPRTKEELMEYIDSLVERSHDYGTAVYAMSMAAVAAYNYVASKEGVTGFQASCADMDFLRRNRLLKHGFRIINYENLLYPQYYDDEHFPSASYLVQQNKKWLKEEAQRKLDEADNPHPKVRKHWEWLASLEIGEGEDDE